jgi:hypothetical protein
LVLKKIWVIDGCCHWNGFYHSTQFQAEKGDFIMNKKLLRNAVAGFAVAGGIGALAATYICKIRPWHLRWGASREELVEPLPGDDVKPDAGVQTTHAITINAPAADVWKWLVQIGQGRGGFYSYDWLENLFGLDIKNTEEIVSEWQELKVGDFVRSANTEWLGGKYKDLTGWFVVRMEKDHALVLRDEIEHGSWAFILKPTGENQTRFIARVRGNKPANLLMELFFYGIFEPAHFIMEQKMFLTLKSRAEEFYLDHTDESELELSIENPVY